ncbi:MAG: AAA family ATPase [Clostridiales bacterium]|mgnify:CR=1 FL=1|nr:AAA family ATPase [Clostridiales bacterium]
MQTEAGSQTRVGQTEDGVLDLKHLFYRFQKYTWFILALTLLLGFLAYTYSTATFVKEYYSELTLAFIKTDQDLLQSDEGTMKKSHTPYIEKDVERYALLLKSDQAIEELYQALQGKYERQDIEKSITVGLTQAPGLMTVGLKGSDAQLIKDLSDVATDTYNKYLKILAPDLGLENIKMSKEPFVVNESKAVKKAFYASVAGAGLALIILSLSWAAKDTLVWPEDLEEKLGLTFLAEVALSSFDEPENFEKFDCFSTLGLDLEKSFSGDGGSVILLASALEDEGRTHVGERLARSLAQRGKKVLFADFNLRRSKTDALQNELEANPGLIAYVQDGGSVKALIQETDLKNFYKIESGGQSQQACQIIGHKKVKGLLEKARKFFDFIIIDSPAALKYEDIRVLAEISDAFLPVIRQDYVGVGDMVRWIKRLEMSGVDSLGAVLTKKDGRELFPSFKNLF